MGVKFISAVLIMALLSGHGQAFSNSYGAEFLSTSTKDVAASDLQYQWLISRKGNLTIFIDAGENVSNIQEHGIIAPVVYTVRSTNVSTERYIPGRPGYRGEYSTRPNGLYFSPIDRKLHLKNADKGTLILSVKETGNWGGTVFSLEDIKSRNFTIYESIHYDNTDGDAYIDTWMHFINDTLEKQLISSGDFLLYSDMYKTRLVRASIAPSIFELPVPRNREEWEFLKDKLKSMEKVDETDFEAMFNQFSGEHIKIKNGILSNFIATKEGFWSIVECRLRCEVESSVAVRYSEPLITGRYVLGYDWEFFIKRFVEPDLIVESISLSVANPAEFEYITLSASIHYQGALPLKNVIVKLTEDNGRLIGTYAVPIILPGDSVDVSQRWLANTLTKGIHILVDPEDRIPETQEDNNVAYIEVNISELEQPSALERVKVGGNRETFFLSVRHI